VNKPKPERRRRDIVTLADLTPRQDVKGGARRRVFGAADEVSPGKPIDASQPAPSQKLPSRRRSNG
jgi:hypothetical protein